MATVELLQPNIEKIREDFHVKETGISKDYFNKGHVAMVETNTLLNKPNPELAKLLNEELKDFLSYSEYMAGINKIEGVGLADLLNEKGRQIVKRLDEIAIEIKSLAVEDSKDVDLKKYWHFYQNGKNLYMSNLKSQLV